MQAIIIYWSKTGNTEKVAHAIHEGLQAAGVDVTLTTVEDANGVDYFDYDLVALGFPSYRWSPPKPMDEFLVSRFNAYHRQDKVHVGAPTVPDKHALVFVTYSGPHSGIREAIPAGLYAGQFFEHIGFSVIDEWYIVGEFHGREDASTQGRLGDIRGRPNGDDLARVRSDAKRIAEELANASR